MLTNRVCLSTHDLRVFLASSFYPRRVAHVPSPPGDENETDTLGSSGDNDTDLEIENPTDWLGEQLEDIAQTNAPRMPARMLAEVRTFP